jgi:hypothetical protein
MCFKVGSNAPFTKLKNLSLSLRRERSCFEVGAEGLGPIEFGIKVLEDIDLNEQRAATTKLATTRMNIAMEIF